MAKHAITWILVADGHRARVFVNAGPGTGLKPALDQEFVHMLPPDRDMAADKAGSARSGGGSHHTLDHHQDLHRHEKAVFARELARRLDGDLKAGRFERLVVIAPPQTLGELRADFSKALAATVDGELDKDLTHATLSDLRAHLEALIAF